MDNKIYHFKALVKELPITSMTNIEIQRSGRKKFTWKFIIQKRI